MSQEVCHGKAKEYAAEFKQEAVQLVRSANVLAASFPAIKTLDGFDFDAGTGVPKA